MAKTELRQADEEEHVRVSRRELGGLGKLIQGSTVVSRLVLARSQVQIGHPIARRASEHLLIDRGGNATLAMLGILVRQPVQREVASWRRRGCMGVELHLVGPEAAVGKGQLTVGQAHRRKHEQLNPDGLNPRLQTLARFPYG